MNPVVDDHRQATDFSDSDSRSGDVEGGRSSDFAFVLLSLGWNLSSSRKVESHE